VCGAARRDAMAEDCNKKIINIVLACTYRYIQLHILSNNNVNMKLCMNKKVIFQEKSSTLIKQKLWLAPHRRAGSGEQGLAETPMSYPRPRDCALGIDFLEYGMGHVPYC
jgi:hypothetical protein